MAKEREARARAFADDGPSPWAGARMTRDEFLALPEVKPRLEFTDGLVTQKLYAHPADAAVRGDLVSAINEVARGQRLGLALFGVRILLPDWAPVPDVSYFCRGRIPREVWTSGEYLTIPPDLAIDVVTAEHGVGAPIRKCLRYLEVGVRVALLCDVPGEAMVVFRSGEPPRVLQGDDRLDLDDVLPGLTLRVGDLFDWTALGWPSDDESQPPTAEQQPPT